ncbi:MAG: class IV adenylate cyclase [Anaerolineae bacterium]|nr:class IV adenylate cyclase [Anaerolineae bacterium]MBT7324950.1 class IV adenylate cyclase [Anaerolineae bacterium]
MYTETEVKFHIADLDKLAARLEEMGAALTSPRTHEYNLRFDTPAETLSADACVLRLRRDAESHLTFKAPSTNVNGVLSREEIEFTVGDFDTAQRFLEALGYEIFAVYEKYRSTYRLGNLHFMLDELPYGNFFEIEGEDVERIRDIAQQLGLQWDAAVKMGYLGIFRRLCAGRDVDEKQLTFNALSKESFSLNSISVIAADR